MTGRKLSSVHLIQVFIELIKCKDGAENKSFGL